MTKQMAIIEELRSEGIDVPLHAGGPLKK